MSYTTNALDTAVAEKTAKRYILFSSTEGIAVVTTVPEVMDMIARKLQVCFPDFLIEYKPDRL